MQTLPSYSVFAEGSQAMIFKAKRVSCMDDQQLIKELKLGVFCETNALIGGLDISRI